MRKTKIISAILALIITAMTAASCAAQPAEDNPVIYGRTDPIVVLAEDGNGTEIVMIDVEDEMVPLASAPVTTTVLSPSAPGTKTLSNTTVSIDISNASEGYIMVRYDGKSDSRIKIVIITPEKVQYTYNMTKKGEYDVIPISGGDGTYTVQVCRNTTENKYAVEYKDTFTAKLKNQYIPFLYPNQYVNFTKDSKVVKVAEDICKDKTKQLDKITAVYEYVIGNFTYDYEKAKTVKSGYLPNVDEILELKKGICFDYASVMCSMLRSQGVASKLVIGYAGTVYHAWINTYTQETGWIEKVIYFDGVNWNLMDPTYASGGYSAEDLKKLIGDGSSYNAMFIY